MKNIFAGKKLMAAMKCIAVLACACAPAAKATIITFGGASRDFTTPYSEGVYTVTPLSYSPHPWQIGGGGLDFDAPNFSGGTLQFEVQAAGGTSFIFSGIDLTTVVLDSIGYSFVGKANNVTVASASGTAFGGNGYVTYGYGSAAQIDSLFVTLNFSANDEGSAQVARLNVSTAVPDQASTVGLFSLALVPLFVLGICQRRAHASA